jgi:UDP-2,3-diacylglucosamine pyrophosphatase LpxH
MSRGFDGIVCGHIHTAEIRRIGHITYYNDGDWVESCTALVEHADGTFEIISWNRPTQQVTEPAHAHPDRDRRLVPAG